MTFLKKYKKLRPNIIFLIAGNFCLQLVNSAYFLVLNLYMSSEGYADYEIGNFLSYRFMAVGFLAIPIGLYIKTRRLKPLYLLSSISLPIISLLILEAIAAHNDLLLQILLILWGVAFSNLFISTMPYILRNVPKEAHTEAISLNSASWSSGVIIVGLTIFILKNISPDFFTDRLVLQIFSCIGFLSVFFILMVSSDNITNTEKAPSLFANLMDYDWRIIGIVTIPVFLIAMGAGLTIPFMNLFFNSIFGLESEQFSLLGSITSILVVLGSLLIPTIKEKWGYEAITKSQTLSIIALISLGTTEFLSSYSFAIYLAIFFYIIRQPLMNLAGPMSAEMSMYYVGKRNQELVSAINSSIWSGSWFFSSQIFRYLREMDIPYGYIIYLTSAFYIIGVIAYHLLIVDFRRKEKAGLLT